MSDVYSQLLDECVRQGLQASLLEHIFEEMTDGVVVAVEKPVTLPPLPAAAAVVVVVAATSKRRLSPPPPPSSGVVDTTHMVTAPTLWTTPSSKKPRIDQTTVTPPVIQLSSSGIGSGSSQLEEGQLNFK
jgi:hypothetical protein